MITEILTRPAEIRIENNSYKIEYDNKAYAQLEMMTGKGVFQIYEGLLKGTLKLSEYNDIVCCALEKHNDSKQIKETEFTEKVMDIGEHKIIRMLNITKPHQNQNDIFNLNNNSTKNLPTRTRRRPKRYFKTKAKPTPTPSFDD